MIEFEVRSDESGVKDMQDTPNSELTTPDQ